MFNAKGVHIEIANTLSVRSSKKLKYIVAHGWLVIGNI